MSLATSAPLIRQLPPYLVNQIAAGEVIERPASVVKELIENSIDAGSTRIEISIQGGGCESIRVSDDGCGIAGEQLPLAVTSHATSKLPDDETLFHVGTLGFRGEAIASIASVSQLTIRSRVPGDDCGHEIRVRGGVIEPASPCGCPLGTVVEVRQLFFNTPVRRRFLKTEATERGHLLEAFTRLALANPRIHFVFRSGDKLVHDLPPTSRWSERVEAFFGNEIAGTLIPIDSDDGQIHVSGYVCEPSVSRGNHRMQYLFLNGRHIRDRALQHALGEAYRGLLMTGRQPIAFLRLRMPPEMVDVNVHPTKLEVRFTDGGRVYSRLLQTLRHHFLSTDMTHRVGPPRPADDDQPQPLRPVGDRVVGLSPRQADQQRQAVIDWARTGEPGVADIGPSTPPSPPPGGLGGTSEFRPFPPLAGPATWAAPAGPGSAADAAPAADAGPESIAHAPPCSGIPAAPPERSPYPGPAPTDPAAPADPKAPTVSHLGFQVHQRYLVTQDDKGMVVIDQHALHERVLYERVCAKVLREGSSLETQRLLVPEPVTLTPSERAAVLDAADAFRRVGLEIDDFGGDSIVIRSYPAMLRRVAPAEMLRTLLEALLGAGKQPDPKDLLNHLLSTIACKAAVKAGDPLTPEEVTSLLEQRDLYHDTHHCPHGRPTALFFSRDELDRMFGRLGPRASDMSR